MLPLLPFLCVAAGWWIAEWFPRLERRRLQLTVLAATLLGAVPLMNVIQTNLRLARTDTRVQAAAWLLQEVGPGTFSVYQTGARWGTLQLPLTADSLVVLRDLAARARLVEGLETLRAYTRMQSEARVAAARGGSVGFRTISYSPEVGFDGDTLPEWIAVMRSPLEQYSEVPPALESVLEATYEIAREFLGVSSGSVGWYDQQDAFYLPFKRIGSVVRPGPDVTLYRRIVIPGSNGTTGGDTP